MLAIQDLETLRVHRNSQLPPAVEKTPLVQRPLCPLQAGFRCIPIHWETGAFSPSQFIVNNPQRILGHSTSPIPGARTLENKFLSGRESLSCALIPTAMEGEIEEENPSAVAASFRHSYKLHPLCSGYSRWQRVQKPYPHILKKQLNILCNVWPKGTKLKFNGHTQEKVDLVSIIPDNNE